MEDGTNNDAESEAVQSIDRHEEGEAPASPKSEKEKAPAKRKRRTKAEMEADRQAAEKAKAKEAVEESDAVMEPAADPPVAKADVPPEKMVFPNQLSPMSQSDAYIRELMTSQAAGLVPVELPGYVWAVALRDSGSGKYRAGKRYYLPESRLHPKLWRREE